MEAGWGVEGWANLEQKTYLYISVAVYLRDRKGCYLYLFYLLVIQNGYAIQNDGVTHRNKFIYNSSLEYGDLNSVNSASLSSLSVRKATTNILQ